MKLLKTHKFQFISGVSGHYVVFNFIVQGIRRYSFEYSDKKDYTLLTGGHYTILTNNDPYHL